MLFGFFTCLIWEFETRSKKKVMEVREGFAYSPDAFFSLDENWTETRTINEAVVMGKAIGGEKDLVDDVAAQSDNVSERRCRRITENVQRRLLVRRKAHCFWPVLLRPADPSGHYIIAAASGEERSATKGARHAVWSKTFRTGRPLSLTGNMDYTTEQIMRARDESSRPVRFTVGRMKPLTIECKRNWSIPAIFFLLSLAPN